MGRKNCEGTFGRFSKITPKKNCERIADSFTKG